MCADESPTTGPTPSSVEGLLGALSGALDAGDPAIVEIRWGELRDRLLAHMQEEERAWIPLVERSSARDARALRSEHAHIRTRLAALSPAVSKPASELRAFVEEVGAHARHEQAIQRRLA
jgi:hypothetical protein